MKLYGQGSGKNLGGIEGGERHDRDILCQNILK